MTCVSKGIHNINVHTRGGARHACACTRPRSAFVADEMEEADTGVGMCARITCYTVHIPRRVKPKPGGELKQPGSPLTKAGLPLQPWLKGGVPNTQGKLAQSLCLPRDGSAVAPQLWIHQRVAV